MAVPPRHKYFTEKTRQKVALYLLAAVYVCSVAVVVSVEPFLTLSCDLSLEESKRHEYANPDYQPDPCYHFYRSFGLFYLTRAECSMGRRLVAAVVMGSFIGWERRQADRPAGIRTMALVSLASCLFTLGSTFAFTSGPQAWDASRISAAIPSGVGFLGAGLIFKESQSSDSNGGAPVVHGLTTAASLWMSAAVGIACGGELYFAASFTCAILLLLLRFGPRIDRDETSENWIDMDGSARASIGGAVSIGGASYGSAGTQDNDCENMSLIKANPLVSSSRRKSTRQTPQLV